MEGAHTRQKRAKTCATCTTTQWTADDTLASSGLSAALAVSSSDTQVGAIVALVRRFSGSWGCRSHLNSMFARNSFIVRLQDHTIVSAHQTPKRSTRKAEAEQSLKRAANLLVAPAVLDAPDLLRPPPHRSPIRAAAGSVPGDAASSGANDTARPQRSAAARDARAPSRPPPV